MPKQQLILLTGTLDAGKTTLLNELEQYPNISVVREVAQDLIDLHGYQITQCPEFQDMVFAEQLSRENTALNLGKRFTLCDRGIPDIIAFSQVIGVKIKPEWRTCLKDRYSAITIFNKDDIHFRAELYQVPFDMNTYRNDVDQSIRSVLNENGIIPFEIKGSHLTRLEQFRALLTELLLIEGNQLSKEGTVKKGRKESI